MPERKLRIVKRQSPDSIGVCEGCNQQFTSHLPQADKAEWEISTLFSRHKCKPASLRTPAKPLPGSGGPPLNVSELSKKIECCAYCGAGGIPLGRDHVPPKCFYPLSKKHSRVRRIKVPACSPCNNGYSDDEAHFRNVMLLAGDCNEAVRELWPTAMRSFEEVDGRKRLRDIRQLIEPVRVSGAERWMIYPARDERILRVVRKIVRGLAYYHLGGAVTSDERIWTDVLRYPIPVELLESETFHDLEPDIFEYWYQPNNDGECSSVWFLKFFEKRVFIASISAAKA